MYNHFSDLEISAFGRMLGSDFNVRRNKAGNITVEYLPEFNKCSNRGRKFWTLYYTSNGGYLWRRHTGYGYCFPLNGVGRKRLGPTVKETWNGKTYYWYPRSFDIKNCEFCKFFEAIDYFIKYLKKYRNIDVKVKNDKNTVNSAVAALATQFNKTYVENYTDSCYFDWLDWFDKNYPVHTISERSEFAIKIDNEFQKQVNKYFGKTTDYNELNELVAAIRIIRDKINTIVMNENYKDYNYILEDVSRSLTQSGKTLQELVHEIYSKLK